MNSLHTALVAGFVLIMTTASNAGLRQPPITDFFQFTDNIYRGASPGYEGLKALKEMGIKTDLNLDNDEDANADELNSVGVLGLKYFPRPMSGFFAPEDEQVDEILSIVADPTNYPIFVHCAHGHDRTGLILGLFRVLNQGWSPEDAYDEMLRYQFHPILFPLKNYFDQRTGLSD